MLGQTLGSITPCAVTLLLQWRAEQLLGQTGGLGETVRVGGQASMEGRAIARPNCGFVGDLTSRLQASMEGRAIARPNSVRITLSPTDGPELQWRAEQLLGQTEGMGGVAPAFVTLQWRAEQLLGQTRRRGGSTAGTFCRASMEGRAIARPNRCELPLLWEPLVELQWRAEQLLGQTRREPRGRTR